MTKQEDKRAEQQARSKLESIVEMVADLDSTDDEARDEALERILEHPLSVQVRSGWCNSKQDMEPEEFSILLCTGGPAVRIYGELGQYNEPDRARLEYQDWFTPWEPLYDITEEESEALLRYCQQFYFGE